MIGKVIITSEPEDLSKPLYDPTLDPNICNDVRRLKHGPATVVCQRPKGHTGRHAGMGCEWEGSDGDQ